MGIQLWYCGEFFFFEQLMFLWVGDEYLDLLKANNFSPSRRKKYHRFDHKQKKNRKIWIIIIRKFLNFLTMSSQLLWYFFGRAYYVSLLITVWVCITSQSRNFVYLLLPSSRSKFPFFNSTHVISFHYYSTLPQDKMQCIKNNYPDPRLKHTPPSR